MAESLADAAEPVEETKAVVPRAGAGPLAASAPAADPTPVSPQTAGLAAIFMPQGSRLHRRQGRPYLHTIRADRDQPLAPPAQGYRVLVGGRIDTFPDGQAIRCSSQGPDQRPVCIAAIQLDKIAFEDGATGSTLAEWTAG